MDSLNKKNFTLLFFTVKWKYESAVFFRNSRRKLFCKKGEGATGGVLKEKVFLQILQNLQENTCAKVSFLIKLQAEECNFIKKTTLAQEFSCEFCEIYENTFFT